MRQFAKLQKDLGDFLPMSKLDSCECEREGEVVMLRDSGGEGK
jgi:hypothetical protein